MPPLENEAANLNVFGWDEIKKHDKETDAWVVKDGEVNHPLCLIKFAAISPCCNVPRPAAPFQDFL